MPEGSHGHPVRSAMIEDTPYRWPLTAVVGWILSRDPAVVLELCEATAGDQAAVLLRAAHGQGEAVEDAWRELAFEFATNEETAWDYGDGRRPPQPTPGPEWDEFVARIKADPGWVVTRDQVLDVWLPDPIPTDQDPDPDICPYETVQWLVHGAKVARTTEGALKRIHLALRAGELEATGLKGGVGERQGIDPKVWIDNEIWPLFKRALPRNDPYADPTWEEIRFRRHADVLRLWPGAQAGEVPRAPAGATAEVTTPVSQERVDEWFRDEYVPKCNATGRVPLADKEDLPDARAALGASVKRDAVRNARTKYAPEQWHKTGPRGPRRNSAEK